MTKFSTGGEDGSEDEKHVGDDYFLNSNDKIRFFFEEGITSSFQTYFNHSFIEQTPLIPPALSSSPKPKQSTKLATLCTPYPHLSLPPPSPSETVPSLDLLASATPTSYSL